MKALKYLLKGVFLCLLVEVPSNDRAILAGGEQWFGSDLNTPHNWFVSIQYLLADIVIILPLPNPYGVVVACTHQLGLLAREPINKFNILGMPF